MVSHEVLCTTPIHDRSGAQNLMADHLSRIERVSEDSPIRDDFPDDHLYILYSIYDSFPTPWFANIVNYLVASVLPPVASKAQNDKINSDAKHYIWDYPYLWKLCSDRVDLMVGNTSPNNLVTTQLPQIGVIPNIMLSITLNFIILSFRC